MPPIPSHGGLSNDEYNRWVQVERALATNAADMRQLQDAVRQVRDDLNRLRDERREVGGELARKIDDIGERVEKFEAEQKFWRRVWSYVFWGLGVVVAAWQLIAPWLFRRFIDGPSP